MASAFKNNKTSLYEQLDKAGWPRTYQDKFYLVAFVAAELPILMLGLLYLIVPETRSLPVAIIVGGSSILGGLFLFWALRGLLAPVRLIQQALTGYWATNESPRLPLDHHDEAGQLMRDVDRAIYEVAKQNLDSPNPDNDEALSKPRVQLAQAIQLFMEMGLSNTLARVWVRSDDPAEIQSLIVQLIGQTRAVLRNTDWVLEWDDDSFVILLHTASEGAKIALEKIMIGFQKHQETQIYPSFQLSVGYTQVHLGDDLDYCLDRLSRALSDAWRRGENQLALV